MFKQAVVFQGIKNLTNILKYGMLSVSRKPDDDLIFIRHA